ncbi:hypothetical protein KKA53_04650 [Candidatus Dependentiae bacterium]|nr:hypothetical protein [Candidatus Dependentiae bacterium]
MKDTIGKVSAISTVFAALGCSTIYAGIPLGSLVQIPVLGVLGAKGASAKEFLAYAQRVLFFIEIFLTFATTVLVIASVVSIFKMLHRRKRMRYFGGVASQLSYLQSDLVVLKSCNALLSQEEQAGLKKSKEKLVAGILEQLQGKFIVKNSQPSFLKRTVASLKLIGEDAIGLDDQILFVDGMVHTFAFMSR